MFRGEHAHPYAQDQQSENPMTAAAASLVLRRARTGGPRDDGPEPAERVLGWVLVVAVAMLVTRLGLL
ncbi:hypothetical protein BJP40_23765 [Streptomyces sp. CC53]|nr:hypothetical protein BJP40_23765 [Streptomyces sp. CC53]OII68501.1 hypothetical protein BJP39_21145 [Streptomyces sp. CC77]